MDHSHSPCSVESLPREDSRIVFMQGFVQEFHQSEQSDQGVWDYVQETVDRASLQDTSNSISGCSYKPQDVSTCRLGLDGERMPQEWYQVQRSKVWQNKSSLANSTG